ncbi:MAG: hypothetical protein GX661_05390 [Acholeplasmataceae bacterium]|nr:hypothetical protein [Acholeplasmataceae bacterium]
MKNIINDLVNSFRVAKMKRKILIVIIGCLYLFIMLAVTIRLIMKYIHRD